MLACIHNYTSVRLELNGLHTGEKFLVIALARLHIENIAVAEFDRLEFCTDNVPKIDLLGVNERQHRNAVRSAPLVEDPAVLLDGVEGR